MNGAADFTDTERESLILKAALESINEMVNYEVMALRGKTHEAEIHFKSATHQKFFNVLLVDFLSTPREGFKINQPYPQALASICEHPKFEQDGSISLLASASSGFISWLEREVLFEKIWFPSINKEMRLTIRREEFIKICGNICKHNFAKLTRIADTIVRIMRRNGIELTQLEALSTLDDFYENFHTNVFAYHSSTIAEFLNDIRWGIYLYLLPEFNRSLVREDAKRVGYRYTFPSDVKSDYGKNCYWELMNDIRSEPYMPQFRVSERFKKRY